MTLQGLPDFQKILQGDGFQLFAPYENIGKHTLLPSRLRVAARADGQPDFSLQYYRGQTPLLPPQPYAVLDLRLEPEYPLDAGLALLRAEFPQAVLEPASLSGGALRLRPAGTLHELPTDLLQPVPLSWNGLQAARFILKLSLEAAELVKQALADELLALSASAVVEVIGVSPRLPLSVRFDPAALLGALLALHSSAENQVSYPAILQFFSQDPASLPLQIEGEPGDPFLFAAAMADRVRARFGSLLSQLQDDGHPYLVLATPAEVGSGSFEWDLSLPLQATRPLVLDLHPLEAARQVVREAGLAAVVPDPVVVPPIPTGFHTVDVTANLPDRRLGVLALGVTLTAEPNPPFRPQAVRQAVEFDPPSDAGQVAFRLSPVEPLTYTSSTFVVVTRPGGGLRQMDGPDTPRQGPRLDLTPDDFPVGFILLQADRALLEICLLQGSLCWTEAGEPYEQAFDLDLADPSLAVALPRTAETPTLKIEARALQGDDRLILDPQPAGPLRLGLHSFARYGPHTIAVDCIFADEPATSAQLAVFDFLPEAAPDAPESVTTLAFTPAQPHKEWSYLAVSPFRAGYRFRPHPRSGELADEWSEVRSPFETLQLKAG